MSEPDTTAKEPAGTGDKGNSCEALQQVRDQHADRIRKTTDTLNDSLTKTGQDWAAVQTAAQKQFQEDQDRNRFQEVIDKANNDYWQAAREANESAVKDLYAAHTHYFREVRRLLAEVDAESGVTWSVWLLTGDLNRAAALAATAGQQLAGAATQSQQAS